jgi:hypothetical protein
MMRRAPDRMAEALRIRSEKVKYQWKKGPTNRALFLLLAERTGLADILPAADSLASESRVQNRMPAGAMLL